MHRHVYVHITIFFVLGLAEAGGREDEKGRNHRKREYKVNILVVPALVKVHHYLDFVVRVHLLHEGFELGHPLDRLGLAVVEQPAELGVFGGVAKGGEELLGGAGPVVLEISRHTRHHRDRDHQSARRKKQKQKHAYV